MNPLDATRAPKAYTRSDAGDQAIARTRALFASFAVARTRTFAGALAVALTLAAPARIATAGFVVEEAQPQSGTSSGQPSPAPGAPQPAPRAPLPPRRAGEVPVITQPVVDEANILRDDQSRAIAAIAWDVRQKTGAEIAVLTVRTTAPLDEFTYGMQVLKKSSLGSADKDDGLLLLVAVDDHRARFFTGYGLEGVLPDGRLGAILDSVVIPRFRAGDYPSGIENGMREIARILTTEWDGKAAPPGTGPGGQLPGWFVLLFLLLFLTVVVTSRFARPRRRYHPIFWGGGFGGPMGGGFGGGFGGGGFGGGGFGGGGGGFGGGGAGRSW